MSSTTANRTNNNNSSPRPTTNTTRPRQSSMFQKFLVYSWLVAQSTLSLFTIFYLVTGNPSFYYRSLIAAGIAYSIPVFKSFEGRALNKELAIQLIQNENVQLILYCLIFYFLSVPSLIYLISNFIYSFFHLLNKIIPYTSGIPIVHSTLNKLKSKQESAREIAVGMEVNLIVVLIFNIFTTGLYGIFTVFTYFRYLKLRYTYSTSIRKRITEIDMASNQLLQHPNCPQFVKNILPKIKSFLSK